MTLLQDKAEIELCEDCGCMTKRICGKCSANKQRVAVEKLKKRIGRSLDATAVPDESKGVNGLSTLREVIVSVFGETTEEESKELAVPRSSSAAPKPERCIHKGFSCEEAVKGKCDCAHCNEGGVV